MKLETRMELIVILVAAVVVGGWIGLRMAGKSPTPEGNASSGTEGQAPQQPPAVATPPSPPQKTITVEPPVPTAPKIPTVEEKSPAPNADLQKVAALLKEGKRYEARAILTPLILKTPEGAIREQMRAMLEEINRVLFFSRTASPDADMVVIRTGDNLSTIVKRDEKDYYFTDLVMQINNIRDAKRIRVGQKIKIPKGTFSAIVQKRAHRLIILLNGHYIKEYPVGLGAPGSETPAENFVVSNSKQVNPDWTSPDGHVYKYGDPRNILGTRWIGFRETDLHQGYGIHGTNDETTIGKNISNGCIRMLQKDVEEVFTMLGPGDAITIVE